MRLALGLLFAGLAYTAPVFLDLANGQSAALVFDISPYKAVCPRCRLQEIFLNYMTPLPSGRNLIPVEGPGGGQTTLKYFEGLSIETYLESADGSASQPTMPNLQLGRFVETVLLDERGETHYGGGAATLWIDAARPLLPGILDNSNVARIRVKNTGDPLLTTCLRRPFGGNLTVKVDWGQAQMSWRFT